MPYNQIQPYHNQVPVHEPFCFLFSKCNATSCYMNHDINALPKTCYDSTILISSPEFKCDKSFNTPMVISGFLKPKIVAVNGQISR